MLEPKDLSVHFAHPSRTAAMSVPWGYPVNKPPQTNNVHANANACEGASASAACTA
jgi:hypothetical protein